MPQVTARKDELMGRIDSILSMEMVEYRYQRLFLDALQMALELTVLHGEAHATEALEVLWYFIAAVPRGFDNVHDVFDMTYLCSALAEDALNLAVLNELGVPQTIQKLLAAYVADDMERFNAVPELLSNRSLPENVRQLAAEFASETRGGNWEQQERLKAMAANAPRSLR